MSQINRINRDIENVDLGQAPESCHATQLPLDHQLSFKRGVKEHWQYRDNRIYINNEDVEDLLVEFRDDVSFQSAVSEAISDYKEEVRLKGNGQFQKFAVRADSVQDKILCNMKRIYDERTGGVRLSLGDGAYLLNNLNVRALLAMYHVRPTEKARRFLRGLKSKLGLILVNKNGSPHFERVHAVIKSLYDEVDRALDETPIDGHYLPVYNGRDSV